jgi:large repetitive protein
VALPATGRAQTVTFVNATQITIPGTYTGPATPYPSSVNVSGLSGTVARASVLLIDVTATGNSDELDLALVGPTGEKVMLWSDACGSTGFTDREFLFDDSATAFLSDPGPCPAGTYMASNYEDPALDDLSALGAGPSPPYNNKLSFFNGISPNGTWGLYAFSDTDGDLLEIGGWALTLEIQPPPAPAATTQIVAPQETGQRAAAQAKCKKKKTKKTRKKCRKKAQLLPL